MKTVIEITGQEHGNRILKVAISTINCGLKNTNFGNFELIFKTKKEAVKAMSDAFKKLKSKEVDYYKDGGINYERGVALHYDTSSAIIYMDRI